MNDIRKNCREAVQKLNVPFLFILFSPWYFVRRVMWHLKFGSLGIFRHPKPIAYVWMLFRQFLRRPSIHLEKLSIFMTDSVGIRQIFFFEFSSLQVLSSFFSPLLSQIWSKPFQVIRRSLGSIDGGKSTRINNTSGIITSPEVQFLSLANCIDVDLGHLSPTPPSFLPSSDYTETKDTVQRKHNCVSRQTLQL